MIPGLTYDHAAFYGPTSTKTDRCDCLFSFIKTESGDDLDFGLVSL